MTNLRFEQPFGGLRGNVRTSFIAGWKGVVDFLFAVIELASSYGWDLISRYWRFSKGVGHFERKFYVEGDVASQPVLVLEN